MSDLGQALSSAQYNAQYGFNDPYNQIMANMPNYNYEGSPGFGDAIGEWFTGSNRDAHNQKVTDMVNAYTDRAAVQSARAWEEYMDSTATQRRVKDIAAAGLNPWLALQSGSIGVNGDARVSSSGKGIDSVIPSTKRSSKATQAVRDVIGSAARMIMMLAFLH